MKANNPTILYCNHDIIMSYDIDKTKCMPYKTVLYTHLNNNMILIIKKTNKSVHWIYKIAKLEPFQK